VAVNDELFALELHLADYPEGEEGSGMNRRMILREALERIERDARQRGYTDGVRDSSEAAHIEQEIRRKRGTGKDDGDD
jgi:hypothetical protein